MGGKSQSAKKIVEMIPKHHCFVESNFGAGWIFFEKTPSEVEVINDIDGELINFWRVVQRDPQGFIDRSKYEFHSREMYNEYASDFKSGKHFTFSMLERAFRYYVIMKMSYAAQFLAGWGFSNVRNQANSLFNEFLIIDKVAERLKNAQIENNDFQFVIDHNDSVETLHYCDPPYIKSMASNDKYYKMPGIPQFTMHDHQRLYKSLCNVKGKFILTIDDCEFVRDRYCQKQGQPFYWMANEVFYRSTHSDCRRQENELIITNYNFSEVVKEKRLVKLMNGSSNLSIFD